MSDRGKKGAAVPGHHVRPNTRALERLIRDTVEMLERPGGKESGDAVLFLGNSHQAFPTLVVHDPVLEPVDKLVWMVICQSGQGGGAGAAFPTYSDIARKANVASTSTVSRAIALLRATRWLSLCARVRDVAGRFGGNVYALHDEPLPLSDAIFLDPGYMEFLENGATHHHARVQRITNAVLESIEQDIEAGVDVLVRGDPIARRLDAAEIIEHQARRRYFSFSASVLARLSNARGAARLDDQEQISKPVARSDNENLHPQNSKAVSCSSNYIKTTTTTPRPKESKTGPDSEPLVYPARLEANQRSLASRYVSGIKPQWQQCVLDELEGRLRAVERGARPLYDELRYLNHLCGLVKRGEFEPNLGLAVRNERTQRLEAKREAEQPVEERTPSNARSPDQRHAAEVAIAAMREIIGRSRKTSSDRD